MSYRSGKAIKRAIIRALKDSELSVSKLERAANISTTTMKTHLDELHDLGIITIAHHKRSRHNGRPYDTVKLTEYGKNLV